MVEKRELSVRLVSLIPLAVSLVCGKQQYLPMNIQEKFSYYTPWSFQMPDYRYIDAYTYTNWKSYVPLALALFILGLVLLEVLWSFGRDSKGIIFADLWSRFLQQDYYGLLPHSLRIQLQNLCVPVPCFRVLHCYFAG